MSLTTYPLDLEKKAYSYIERPNPAILDLLGRHIGGLPRARILDVGCGCGANARAFKQRFPKFWVTGIEPNERAANLARRACDEVFTGTFQEWGASQPEIGAFDAVVLSDVLEHIADPIPFLRDLLALPAAHSAVWIVSVPNYAVWYNRLRTLAGLQSYGWSGLWDRTHLRFYTRESARKLLTYCGLSVLDTAATPSLGQSLAPALRPLFEHDVDRGEHLALAESLVYKMYQRAVEPTESRICGLWPELLGFQVVFAARLAQP
jgi:SAM-dependent methyltransferase